MIFAILVLFSAFLIEGIGTYVSVVGLSSLFAANPVIITLAIALDIGKVVTVSFLYKYWHKVNWLMKSYMTIAAIVLMVITSAGAFGFLSGEFQKAISGTNSQNVVLAALTDEQSRLQARKTEIDKQVSQLKTDNVKGRTQLMRQFGPEVTRINKRLEEIDKELPSLKVESIKKNVEVGPILYVAEAFNTTPEQAVKWVIFIIIFVFDPLAVALLIAGNYLIELRKKEKAEIKQEIIAETIEIEIPSNEMVNNTPEPELTSELIEEPTANVTVVEQPVELPVEPQIQEPIQIEEEVVVEEPETVSPISEEQVDKAMSEIVAQITPNIPEISLNIEPPVLDVNEEVVEEKPIEPVVNVEPVKEKKAEPREVITLQQVINPHKSSLDSISASDGDIEFTGNEHKSSSYDRDAMMKIYRD